MIRRRATVNDNMLELRNVTKTFGNVIALNDVNFSVMKGEIRGLLGENGAGKSTLMKVIYGLYHPDEGDIYFHGKLARVKSPFDSIKLGIGMVHQESTLVPVFTAVENIIVGTKGNQSGLSLNRKAEEIKNLSEEIGLTFPLDVKVRELAAGEKQKVEIIRALFRGAELLILDEPTTSLVESEFQQLLRSLQKLVEKGLSIIFITHKIREVIETCDSVTVLRKGEVQETLPKEDLTKERLVKLMFMEKNIDVTESALPRIQIRPTALSKQPICVFKNVFAGKEHTGTELKNISLEIYGGEILGIASVSGNGEKELADCFVDPSCIKGGEVRINDIRINKLSTTEVFAQGMFYTPEDRIRDGILPEASLIDNVLLGHHNEKQFLKYGMLIDRNQALKATKKIVEEFSVATPNENIAIRRLSGGNIQKVIIGRAFVSPINFLVTHNPTSGLDISTVEFIFEKLLWMRSNVGAILWINEDLDELMLLSDRIAVLHEGEIKAILNRNEFDKYQIGLLMVGGA